MPPSLMVLFGSLLSLSSFFQFWNLKYFKFPEDANAPCPKSNLSKGQKSGSGSPVGLLERAILSAIGTGLVGLVLLVWGVGLLLQ